VFELKDAPGDAATHTFLEILNKATGNTEPWTPRKLGETMEFVGFHPAPVGTPEMVADVLRSGSMKQTLMASTSHMERVRGVSRMSYICFALSL
jgi:hypothetical protein